MWKTLLAVSSPRKSIEKGRSLSYAAWIISLNKHIVDTLNLKVHVGFALWLTLVTSKSGLVVGTLHSASASRTWPTTTTMKATQAVATTSSFIFKFDALESLYPGQLMRRCRQLISTYLFYSQLANDDDYVDDTSHVIVISTFTKQSDVT